MPVDRATFDAVQQRVIATAPLGLFREQFNKLLDAELTKMEAPEHRPVVTRGGGGTAGRGSRYR
jgi:hypothetical protein